MARPWLFLDLDGVISPLPPRDTDTGGGDRFQIPAGHITQMHVDERLPDGPPGLTASTT